MSTLDLQDGFPPADWAAWEEVARRALSEAFEVEDASGLEVRALYGPRDAVDRGAPGAGEGVRGWGGPRVRGEAMAVAQEFREPDGGALVAAVAHDAAGGLEEAWITLDGELARGAAPDPDGGDGSLGWLPGAPLDLGGASGWVWAGVAAPALVPWLTPEGVAVGDPIGALLRAGELAVGWSEAWDRLARAVPAGVALGVDGTIWHESGATPDQEIAAMVAAGLEVLRACEGRGLEAAACAPRMVLRVSVAPEVGLHLAKVRALRGLWAGVLRHLGLEPARHAPRLVASGSRRHRAAVDVWTNLLRGTLEGFVASCAGVDAAALPALDEAVGLPGPIGRRLARNTLLLLRHECGLDRVLDPLGGAFGLEAHTQALMESAWSTVRRLEREGGLIRALVGGWPQREVAERAAAEAAALEAGELALVGVTLHPPDVDRPADARSVSRPDAVRAHLDAHGGASPLAAELTTWGPPAVDDPRVTPLAPARLGAPFEVAAPKSPHAGGQP